MPAVAPWNFAQSNAAGSFTISNDGGVQGVMLDDPAVRFTLRSGYVLQTETLPMLGGVLIFEDIPTGLTAPLSASGPDTPLQSGCGRATSLATASAISILNQAYNGPTTPWSPVPEYGSGMTFNYVRLGSGARVQVAVDPSILSLAGGYVGQNVSWDFGVQRLCPFVAAYPAVALNGLTWTSASGGSVTGTTASAHGLAPGDDFTMSGNVPAAFNGTFTAGPGTTASTITFLLPAASNPGPVTTLGTILGGGGAFPCKINRFYTTNFMVPVFNPATGYATWNRNGVGAEIQV
jgi:hypothetical protein